MARYIIIWNSRTSLLVKDADLIRIQIPKFYCNSMTNTVLICFIDCGACLPSRFGMLKKRECFLPEIHMGLSHYIILIMVRRCDWPLKSKHCYREEKFHVHQIQLDISDFSPLGMSPSLIQCTEILKVYQQVLMPGLIAPVKKSLKLIFA